MQYFVMLVSDQTMPNLTFLTHLLKTNEGLLIFLTTQQMKDIKKVEAIISALNYQGEYTEILLEPENLKENQSILKENIKDINSTFIVNLTCGNKIMTLSAYLFFSQISNASIYYLPINSNTFNLIYPRIPRIF